jgi:hypothetical protein
MNTPRTPGKWMDCGDGMVSQPVSGSALFTRVIEAEGWGRIGEWIDYSNEPEGNFQAILTAVNCHEDLMDALCQALPFVEDACSDPAYKRGAVDAIVKQIRAAIAQAEGGKTK